MNTCLKHGLGSGGSYNVSDDDDDDDDDGGAGFLQPMCKQADKKTDGQNDG